MNDKLVKVSSVSQDEVCKAIAIKALMFAEKFKKKLKDVGYHNECNLVSSQEIWISK